MAKKQCPLEKALKLFNNEAEKLVDFTMNCRSLYFRLDTFFNEEMTFENFTNTVAELTRVNEILRVAHQNWEADNTNIVPEHIQFLGSNADYSVFHFGRINNNTGYVDFSIRNEGNAHYVVDRVYDANAKDDFVLTYTLMDIYNQLQTKFDEYIKSENSKAIDEYLNTHESCDCEECECREETTEECSDGND